MKRKGYYNALAKMYYNEQIIEEACNADDTEHNHFRCSLTLSDCVRAYQKARYFGWIAKMYKMVQKSR